VVGFDLYESRAPQAVFDHAQAPMLRGDLLEVFACLDVNDLKRVATNAVALVLGSSIDDADEEVRRICDEHRFPLDDLMSARRRVMQMPGMEATTNQRDTMKSGLAAVSNLPAFLAARRLQSTRVRRRIDQHAPISG
jgi:hypothetical protein